MLAQVEGSMQEPEEQSSNVHAAEGALLAGVSMPEQLEPSPLMRWTSDGSMMDELLRTFTCAPACSPMAGAAGVFLTCCGYRGQSPSLAFECTGQEQRLRWRQPR